MLVEGVAHLDQARAVFEAMLVGWQRQMLARGLKVATIESRLWLVRRFAVFTNDYPWRWAPGDVEDFTAALRSGSEPLVLSTIRGYQMQLNLFMEFVCDGRYGWVEVCEARFDSTPGMICHDWNTVRHSGDFEGRPGRRPLTVDELQDLFDHADNEVGRVAGSGRKGTWAAFRDATLMKTVFAWGLRRGEAVGLDAVDCHRHVGCPAFGSFGALHVRWGKAKRGGPPRRRTVISLFDWAVEGLSEYVNEVRPRFDPGNHPALWVTERRSRLSARAVDERFAQYRLALGLPAEIDLHCLRHSYVTHLVEAGYPERFVSEQVGHSASATTAIYTNPRELHRTRAKALVAC